MEATSATTVYKMSTTLNRSAVEKLIAEDIEWLETCPDTLERQHIKDVLADWLKLTGADALGEKEELKPCPFCGKQAGYTYDAVAYLPPSHLIVTCSCGAIVGGFRSREEATAAWNRRVPSPQSTASIHKSVRLSSKIGSVSATKP